MQTLAQFWRSQRPVGQGGFHAAGIEASVRGNRKFHFVYDCGAMPQYAKARKREIEKYVKELGGPGSRLDLLFLSHAHADHINGVPELLASKTGLRVDTIVMPLMPDAERLIAFAAAVAADSTLVQSAFLRRFTVDQVATLSAFRPRQILIVGRGSDGSAPGSADVAPFEPPEDGEVVFPDGGGEDWVQARLIGSGKVEDLTSRHSPVSGISIRSIQDTSAIALPGSDRSAFWLLAPYVHSSVTAGHRKFRSALVNITKLRWSASSWREDLNKTLKAKDGAKKLRDAYQSVGLELNLTSLCLYSGPAQGIDAYSFHKMPPCFCCGNSKAGWLSVGDTTLHKPSIRSELLGHYKALLPKVGSFVLPHHGSDDNFDAGLFDAINPDLAVVAADTYKTWRHPGISVVQAVASRGVPMRLVTSDRRSALSECGEVWK